MLKQDSGDSLSIVIPAYNEEEAISATITRCLDARAQIKRAASLVHVEIIVVSDGSTDRTAAIASSFPEVKVIEFESNRGYGVAIKEGFAKASGSLLAFLDADGTCDPNYFAQMCQVCLREKADVVLGARLGAGSKMPPIRKLGNRIFATLLGFLCGRQVTDTASGMRVLRRESLAQLYPLPDRMHFTPAMSSRALMNNLHIVEVPMAYEERIGRSKLRVISDGICFLRTIFSAVLCYRPERLFLMGFAACAFLGALLAIYPLEYYAHNRRLEEWMIYRFTGSFLLGVCCLQMLSATALAAQMSTLGPRRRDGSTYWPSIIRPLFEGKLLAGFLIGLLAGSTSLLWPGVIEYVVTGHMTMHWSRLFVGSFVLLMAVQTLVTSALLQVLAIWKVERDETSRSSAIELLRVPSLKLQEENHDARAA